MEDSHDSDSLARVQARFIAKVKWADEIHPTLKTRCLSWTASRFHNGYGRLYFARGKVWATHRLAWLFANGEIPDGLDVLHKCDNPGCVNVEHLFLGTQFDNMKDCAAKGRNTAQLHPERRPRGSANGASKLSESDVMAMRGSSEPNRVWAKRLGIRASSVWRIRQRQNWNHLP